MRWKVDGEDFIAFEGEMNSISFVGPVPRRQGKMANYMIRMAVVNEGKTNKLEMYWRIIGPQEQGFAYLEDGERTTLLKGMGKIEFAYYGGETELSDPVWRNYWSRSGALPQLIRIRFSSSDGAEWPELVVAPVLDADSDPANVRGRVCILC
jgi:general secretion pathway protein J